MNGWAKTGTYDLKRSVQFRGVSGGQHRAGISTGCRCTDRVGAIPLHPFDFEFPTRGELPRRGSAHWAKQGEKFVYRDVLPALRAVNRGGNNIQSQLGILADSTVGGYWPRPVKCFGHSSTQGAHFQRDLVYLAGRGSVCRLQDGLHHCCEQT